MKNIIKEPKNFWDWTEKAYYPSEPTRSPIRVIVDLFNKTVDLDVPHISNKGISTAVFDGRALSITLDNNVDAVNTFQNFNDNLEEFDKLLNTINYSLDCDKVIDAQEELESAIKCCQQHHEGEYSMMDFYEHFDGADHSYSLASVKENYFVTDLDYTPEARKYFMHQNEYICWITAWDAGYVPELEDEAEELMQLSDEAHDGQTYDQIENGGKQYSEELDIATKAYIQKYREL